MNIETFTALSLYSMIVDAVSTFQLYSAWEPRASNGWALLMQAHETIVFNLDSSTGST